MPGRFDQDDLYDEAWEIDDPEGPQECDLIDDDDDETPAVPCPNCRRPVPDFADRCPYCGEWIVQSTGVPTRRNVWFVVVVLAVIAAFVYWYVF
ncbi:MAG: hypothetical protein KAY37_13735 [Phycisphaerae bacterium]|nr:hypothetical protein [Phycisphaerae bacterium]